MKLVVDIGNSRIKWARFEGGVLGDSRGLARRRPPDSALDEAWGGLAAPSAILISSVAGQDFEAHVAQWMAARWGRRPRWFRARAETLGLLNGYTDPAQLGSDRWAALIGARERCRGAFGVVDAGTAVTLDVVDAEQRHLGGLIFPGPELAAQSLLQHTASIRGAPSESDALLGRSTGECVANGVRFGLAGAIARCVAEVDGSLSEVTWFATGGAWPRLGLTIDRCIDYDPDLVLKGLARALEQDSP